MTQNNELYDHLSAARIVYQENLDNELYIIRELKIYLLESGFPIDNINNELYNFYRYINVNIELNTITEISISQDSILNNIVQNIFNPEYLNNDNNDENENDEEDNNNEETDDNDDAENESDNNLIIYTTNTNHNNINIINVLNTLVNNLNNSENLIQINQNNFQNVAVTIDDEDFENLNSKILTCDHDSNCSICMSQMIKDEKITLLKCNHNFHYECISPYLKEYNYKCPVCRAEVGKPKYNI